MNSLSPIGAITNRLSGRKVSQPPSNTSSSHQSNRAKPGSEKELFQHKVNLLLSNPAAFAEFKKCVSETNNFSNTGALNLLYLFLEDFDVPELENKADHGSFGFGFLNSIRTMAGEVAHPQSPVITSTGGSRTPKVEQPYSPLNKSARTTPTFTSDGSSMDSPTSSHTTRASLAETDRQFLVSPEDYFLKQMERIHTMPACLEQPSLSPSEQAERCASSTSKKEYEEGTPESCAN